MTNPKSQPKPDGLEQKFKLLALLPYDERARRKHSLVFGFILDWYHRQYGDALASVRHVVEALKVRDPAGKGLGQASVHSALTDLTAWGYLQQNVGSGKRASRYIPNWSMLDASVHPVENTTSVHPALNDDVHPALNASADSVHPVGNEDPSTPIRVQDPETGIDGLECAAPTAPLADGLGATAARTAQGGFDELWDVYAHKQKKAEARRAYAKLAPDAELHAILVDAARAWQLSWAAQNRPDAPRFTLGNWIEREEYECVPPTAFKAKERKPKTKVAAERSPPAASPTASYMAGNINPFSDIGTFRAQIVSSTVLEEQPGEQLAILEINWSGPRGDQWPADTWHEFLIHSEQYAPARERGRRMIDSIAAAVGLDCIEDTEELHRRPFLCTIHKDLTITYAPLPANDNQPVECAA